MKSKCAVNQHLTHEQAMCVQTLLHKINRVPKRGSLFTICDMEVKNELLALPPGPGAKQAK